MESHFGNNYFQRKTHSGESGAKDHLFQEQSETSCRHIPNLLSGIIHILTNCLVLDACGSAHLCSNQSHLCDLLRKYLMEYE